MKDLNSTLDTLWQFATEFCAEVRDFQPDLILVLMHSGWMPFLAGRELWNRVETAPLPPVICTNLGREKVEIFNKTVRNPHAITAYLLPIVETDASIAFFLAWLAEKTDWQAALRAQIQAELGAEIPKRILIVDELSHEGGTILLTQGLLNLLYPSAQTRFIEMGLEWHFAFWENWTHEQQPQLLELAMFGEPAEGQIFTQLWQTGRQTLIGTVDLTPDNLGWQKITAATPLLADLTPLLPLETWLSLPAWAEGIVQKEIARRVTEYAASPLPPEKQYPSLPLKQRLLRDLLRFGSLNVRQVSDVFGLSLTQAQREITKLRDDGLLLVEKNGRENRFVASPSLKAGHRWGSRPFLDCCWVVPGQLLVGEIPGWYNPHENKDLSKRLDGLLEQGVTFFLDLANQPYRSIQTYRVLLEQKTSPNGRPILYRGVSLPRFNLPARSRLQACLDLLDEVLAAGQVVYLHDQLLGGVAETVAACWLVRHGQTGQQALDNLNAARQGMFEAWRQSPYKETARKLVRSWQE
jgi:hypothetical protein